MNTIQNALARLAALRDALGSAAGKAGHFVADEARGFMHNISPSQIEARAQGDVANHDAMVEDTARGAGWPGGTAQWAQAMGGTPQTNMVSDLAGRIANMYRKIKSK